MPIPDIQYNPNKDYYERLGVPWHASDADVLRAFRVAVKRHHPDVGGDPTGEAIRVVYEAYAVLGHPMKRAWYNASRTRFGPPRGAPLRRHAARRAGRGLAKAAVVALSLTAAACLFVAAVLSTGSEAPRGSSSAAERERPSPVPAFFEYATPFDPECAD